MKKIYSGLFLLFLLLIFYISCSVDDCPIKGSKNKIYHLRGSHYYNSMKHYECFNNEDEARYKGYRKAK